MRSWPIRTFGVPSCLREKCGKEQASKWVESVYAYIEKKAGQMLRRAHRNTFPPSSPSSQERENERGQVNGGGGGDKQQSRLARHPDGPFWKGNSRGMMPPKRRSSSRSQPNALLQVIEDRLLQSLEAVITACCPHQNSTIWVQIPLSMKLTGWPWDSCDLLV